MTSSSPGKSPKTAAGNTTPPSAGRSARQEGTARPNRNQNRAVARAGTPGSAQSGLSPLAGWTIAFVAVAAVVIGAALLLSVMSQSSPSGIKTPSVLTPTNIAFSGRTLGKEDAPVTVLLYGDFRCSACFNFTEGGTELNLVTNYVVTGRAKLVWQDRLIIDELRQDGTASRDAANAAMCAADQNKFWPMHDWLYANQSTTEDASAFTPARLSNIGKAAGLDMTRLQPCMDAGTHNAEISAANLVARKTINGTPTVYVNGKVAGDPSHVATYDQIKAAIDAEPATVPSAAPATTAPSPMPSPTPAVTPAPSAQPSTKPS
jgi:protein-disulfide isomerase